MSEMDVCSCTEPLKIEHLIIMKCAKLKWFPSNYIVNDCEEHLELVKQLGRVCKPSLRIIDLILGDPSFGLCSAMILGA